MTVNNQTADLFKKTTVRFAISGVVVTIIHIILAVLFIKLFQATPPLANGLAFIFATICSYIINTIWSFSKKTQTKNLVRFITVSLLGVILATTISGSVEMYKLHYSLGIAFTVILVPPTTFILHNIWTYK